MWIKTQDNQLINLDHAVQIYIWDRDDGTCELNAEVVPERTENCTIGHYKTKKEAKEAFNLVQQAIVENLPLSRILALYR